MTALVNGEFEFRGMRFGTLASGYPLKPGGFSVGAYAFRVQDQDNAIEDGRTFGRDYLAGATYAWDLLVVDQWQDASQRMSEFRKTWHSSPVRNVPRAVDELKLWHGDRVGVVLGRARNYAEDRTKLRKGLGGILCDFAAINDLVYDENYTVHGTQLVESSLGGLSAPLVAPLVGASSGSSRAGFFTVGGDAVTPAIVRFTGPVSYPRLTIAGRWTVGINVVLGSDEWVEVDTRPMCRTVLHNGWGSVAGMLTRDTAPLADMVLLPGTHETLFTGIDPTNTATASIRWRNARYSV